MKQYLPGFKNFQNYTLAIFCWVLISSCNNKMPGGFWANFQKNLLVKNITDQGPDGGTRAMYWKADEPNTLRPEEILDFASKKGWHLVDSIHFTADSVKKWKLHDTEIFPLSDKGLSWTENNELFRNFPRWINSNITLYRFKTSWVLIEAGTDKSTEENGFIILNDTYSEMSVYHFWGQ